LRGKTPIRKVILEMKTNTVAWNPMRTFDLTAANEDHNLYTFDMRKMDQAKIVHKDHVSAV
jgi:WD repeat and SOF domain-containing protein 1